MKRRDPHQYLKTRNKEMYFIKAKKEGYRARSAYKLIQIEEKFNVIPKSGVCMDLGCAPGAWLQVINKHANKNLKIIGVDLLKIEPVEGVEFYQEDIYSQELFEKLSKYKFNTILSDIAQNCTGDKKRDHFNSYNLIDFISDQYFDLLITGGDFCFKLFDGSETVELIKKLKTLFENVKIIKPKASASDSVEIYIVCKRKKYIEKQAAF